MKQRNMLPIVDFYRVPIVGAEPIHINAYTFQASPDFPRPFRSWSYDGAHPGCEPQPLTAEDTVTCERQRGEWKEVEVVKHPQWGLVAVEM